MENKKTNYNNAWRDRHYKRFELIVPFSKPEIIEKLKKVDNKSAYIINLIDEDIKKIKS